MRNMDFDPFCRSSIGFDRLFALIDETLEPEDRYPPEGGRQDEGAVRTTCPVRRGDAIQGAMAMNQSFRKTDRQADRLGAASRLDEKADFVDLLHPARAFARPSDVVDDPDLTLNEKRALLASWASDASAAEANPLLRQAASGGTANWDDVMDALKALDLRAVNSAWIRCDPELFWRPRRGLRGGPGGGPDHGSLPA